MTAAARPSPAPSASRLAPFVSSTRGATGEPDIAESPGTFGPHKARGARAVARTRARRLIRREPPGRVYLFDRAYEGTPLWDIARPQREIVRLEEAGEIRGRVLDLGCGTGENAIYLASQGHPTWAIDFSPRAIEKAGAKGERSSSSVRFEVASALELPALHETFDTLVDCGLFHTFLDPHRPVYAEGVAAALRPGGRFFVLCFSENEPTDWGGPRRISQAELRTTFGKLLRERWTREARFETVGPPIEGRAWLAAFESRLRGSPAPRRGRQAHPPPRSRPRR